MEKVLEGIQKTRCLLDDTKVAGSSEDEHLQLLDQVLERLNRYNLTVNRKKCSFFQQGIYKVPEKVKAVLEAPQPSNVIQLRGIVNYYHRFLPNRAHKLAPLHHLLQNNVKWAWTPEFVTDLHEVQQVMASDIIVTHFDLNQPITLSYYASPYGLGEVLLPYKTDHKYLVTL